MSITAYVKSTLAVLAAAMAGIVLGVASTIGMAYPSVSLASVPAWIPQAEWLGWLAGFGAALTAAGWIYIDWRYVATDG